MAYNEGLLNTFSANAAADLSGKQFYAMSLTSDGANGVRLALATAGKGISGVLQNNPVSGQAACCQSKGISPVAISPNQTVTGGTTLLEVDTPGTFKPVAMGIAVAQALENVVSTANIMIISARLLPSNAALS